MENTLICLELKENEKKLGRGQRARGQRRGRRDADIGNRLRKKISKEQQMGYEKIGGERAEEMGSKRFIREHTLKETFVMMRCCLPLWMK